MMTPHRAHATRRRSDSRPGPRESARAISRPNTDRHPATSTDMEPLSGLLKYPVSLLGNARRCPGCDFQAGRAFEP